MMQVQGSNMMDMSGNSPASFWAGARHPSWSSSGHGSGHAGANTTNTGGATGGSNNSDPKMAEKLMTELQVSEFKVRLLKTQQFLS